MFGFRQDVVRAYRRRAPPDPLTADMPQRRSKHKRKQFQDLLKVGVDEAHEPTEVSALPACICIWIGFLARAPITRFWVPQESINSGERMTEIKFCGSTFVGTAEGDHGVFTNNINGNVFAGSIAGGYPCVGVYMWPDGTTAFVECDADGNFHGRVLDCFAGGATRYFRYEHGSEKEHAVLYANGTCKYDIKACRADYAPFVALRAKVLPIKARPRTSAPTAACMPPFFRQPSPP
jgi:hypothetical protein